VSYGDQVVDAFSNGVAQPYSKWTKQFQLPRGKALQDVHGVHDVTHWFKRGIDGDWSDLRRYAPGFKSGM
jgi:hypothetical protein